MAKVQNTISGIWAEVLGGEGCLLRVEYAGRRVYWLRKHCREQPSFSEALNEVYKMARQFIGQDNDPMNDFAPMGELYAGVINPARRRRVAEFKHRTGWTVEKLLDQADHEFGANWCRRHALDYLYEYSM